MKSFLTIFLYCGLLLWLVSCNKSETLETGTINDYFPIAVGKYQIFKLDSFVYVNFGQTKERRTHIIKDTVDAAIADNLGRPSFRVRRLFRNEADTMQWVDQMTYLVTPTRTSLEVVEENLRVIKLQLPVWEFVTWNGNRYLPDDIYPEFGFNSTTHSRLSGWEYSYENVDMPMTVNGLKYDSTVTVTSSVNDSIGFPPTALTVPAFKTVWLETFARGVGLVSRHISLEEFQPRSSSYPSGYYSGFEVKQVMMRHN
jgi:hypothetical protein